MTDQKDYIGLSWVKKEVEHLLAETSKAFDAYLEQPTDNSQLIFCQTRLHQVQVSLNLLPQKGASLLTGELIAVTDALINKQTTNTQLTTETLIQGVLQLTAYIEKTVRSGIDKPYELLEMLSALRNHRHGPSLNPLDFFFPDYGSRIQPLDDNQLDHLVKSGNIKLIRKIRQKYQVCLAKYLRQQEPEQNLELMLKLFGKLQNLCWGSPSASLWDVSAALTEGLSKNTIKSTELSLSILKELDSQLKQLIESNGLEINTPPEELLLKKILYLIATAEGDSKLVNTLKARYQLNDAITAGLTKNITNILITPKTNTSKTTKKDHLTDLSPPALDSGHKIAALEAITEIAQVKHAITDYLSNNRNIEYLSTIPKLLENAQNTLSIQPLTACAEIIKQGKVHIETMWLKEYLAPSQKHIEAIQKGLSSLDDYLQTLIHGDIEEAECHLIVAQQSIDLAKKTPTSFQPPSLAGISSDEIELIHEEKHAETPISKTKLTFEFNLGKNADTLAESPKTNNLIEKPADKNIIDTSTLSEINQENDLTSAFINTSKTVQKDLDKNFLIWKNNLLNTDALAIILQSFNTLKSSGRDSNANVIGEISSAVEKMLMRLLNATIKPNSSMVSLLNDIITKLPELTDDFASSNQLLTPEVLLFMEQADDLARGEAFFDQEELECMEAAESNYIETTEQRLKAKKPTTTDLIFSSEINVLLSADKYLERWTTAVSVQELRDFNKELKALLEKVSDAKIDALIPLCNVLIEACSYLENHEKAIPTSLYKPLQKGFETLVDLLNQLAAKQSITPPNAIFTLIKHSIDSLLKRKNKNQEPQEQWLLDRISAEKHNQNYIHPEQDLITIFLEEASDLSENCAKALEHWLRHDTSLRPVAELQRYLHTLKGGAKMAEFNDLVNICHALENVYEAISVGQIKSSDAPLGLLKQSHELIDHILQALSMGSPAPSTNRIIKQLESWVDSGNSKLKLPEYLNRVSKNSPLSSLFTKNTEDSTAVNATPSTTQKKIETKKTTKTKTSTFKINADVQQPLPLKEEKIRVTSELIEQLVNLTDESSIHRSQIEQQMTDITLNLSEMDSTIFRLKEQLRSLDIESRTQIISSNKNQSINNSDFDPVEMDQHSELTQLYNALAESASDLVDLRQSLQSKSRNTESLLIQQSRTQSLLQTQLLEVRLVPFSILLHRLQKTVQQLSSELVKPVTLKVSNADVKIDKTIMDKIQAPIEHILRNAITHGIENDPLQRVNAGKPRSGQLHLALSCEGSYISLAISDDGQGVNFKKIKNKALEKDLISSETEPDDDTLLQLIMTSGFSTTSEVTQVSGRGVGLDVVANEVRKLGGSVQIDSKSGQGTRFILQLPFRSSVSRALMVEEGGYLYAFPMQSIDSLIMAQPEELIASYKYGKPIEHGGIKHRVISLGFLLGLKTTPIQAEKCPVIIIQRGGENTAIHVDIIHGGREVITKTLGSQFKNLTCVNGATILGDGRVVVIIDPVEILKKHHKHSPDNYKETLPPSALQTRNYYRILVIDDSITMRKVTAQLLSRHGFNVDSARNGIEAMNQINEKKPDLIMLDVEMPTMDGFEVASAIRNDPNLKSLPIIMITSRTGAKHRKRAKEIGVNEYLGKPFQEKLLLNTINKLISASERGD